mgnify:CR=1 FL=1
MILKCFGRCVGVKSYRCCNSYLRDMVAKEKKKAPTLSSFATVDETKNNGNQQQMNQNK